MLSYGQTFVAPVDGPLSLWSDFSHWEQMDQTDDRSAANAGSQSLSPLLQAVASGDREALQALYESTSAKLYGICLRLLRSESDAEEALQDTFVTVWRKASYFDASKSSPITWLSVLARNKAIDRLRRPTLPTSGIEQATEIEDGGASALELLEMRQQNDRLADCIDELDVQHAAAIRSAFFDGATYRELAEGASVPLGTMKSWIRRSLARLRGCMER